MRSTKDNIGRACFLYEREHLDDAPALVLDLLSTVHENRPLESGRDPSLEAFRRGKRGGELSPDWEDNGFCGIGGRGGGVTLPETLVFHSYMVFQGTTVQEWSLGPL